MEDNIETMISHPRLINIPLFQHQLKSIENMEKMEKDGQVKLSCLHFLNTKLGSLSDEPGYGKTMSVLGLIAKTLAEPEELNYYSEDVKHYKYVSTVRVEICDQVKCSLILVNISLMSQWIVELNKTLLNFKAVYSKGEIENIQVQDYDVILVAHNIYNIFSQVYRKKSWKRFVIDEPASLKICSMESTNSKFYWLITATPEELYLKRRTGFMADLLPEEIGIFRDLIVRNDEDFVRGSYKMPFTTHKYYTCGGNLAELFEGIAPQNFLELLEAGDVCGAFTVLGQDEVQDDDTIVNVYRSKKMKKMLNLGRGVITNIKIIEKIQTIEEVLKTLDMRLNNYLSKNCIICDHEHNPQNTSILSCCQNIFCGMCVNIRDDCCPLCRNTDFNFIKLNLQPTDELKEDPVQFKHKNLILSDILDQNPSGKFLVFSNHNESFVVIKKILEHKKMSYLELRGTKEKRDNTIDMYKTGSINVLLLNTIHSGAGLNLQETTDIVLYHKIHQYQETQVIGRANRIGRILPLTVHHL